MKKFWLTILILIYPIFPALAQFSLQHNIFEKSIVIAYDSSLTTYSLPDSFLIRNSEIIFADSTKLTSNQNYKVNYIAGDLSFLIIPNKTDSLKIYYQILPYPLKKSYFHRELKIYQSRVKDTKPGKLVSTPKSRQPALGSTLKQNGSIVRGVSIGTNQGMKLESGLRMQISGKIADKVEVVAALTDQNTPIQPEGNTQSLQEIDKVFVQIKSDRLQATLGDYYYNLEGTEFSPYNRKLQGIMGTANFENTTFTISGAVSKGKFITNQFTGQEGNQGPYQLKGDRGQIDIIVLAGTEKVWIDGQLMTRGEENDYIIEYSNGQMTFTRNRLITADSRITIDFQYSDQKFQRSLYSANVTTSKLNDKLKLGVRLIRETDNKANPLDFTLNEENRERLELAGDKSDSAYVSGVNYVGENKGYYVAVDSAQIRFYRYVGVNSGEYNISFSYFGPGKGDYKLVGYNQFKYVGKNEASYLPIVLLTPAQSHDLLDFSINYSPKNYISFTSEVALSRLDQNLYSSQDDDDNTGFAGATGINFRPEKLKIGSLNFGKFDLSGKYRKVQDKFRYIGRTDEVEKNRKWNVSDDDIFEEEIIEFSSRYTPLKNFDISGSWGENKKGSNFQSNRWQAGSNIRFEKLPGLSYQIESISSRENSTNRIGDWIRESGSAEYTFWKIKPTIKYLAEEKKETYHDTIFLGLKYFEISPKLEISNWKKMSVSASLTKREQENYTSAGFSPESEALTQTVSWALRDVKNFSMSMQYTHRERTYADSSIGSKMTDLADFRANFSPLKRALITNWHYQLSNTQVAKQEKIYIKVEQGQGNYRYDESLNEYVPDGLTGDYILRIRATEEFIPVVELRASSTIKFKPGMLWKNRRNQKKLSGIQKIVSKISTETFFQMEEKTQEEDVWSIYRMELAKFQNEETTIYGTKTVRQDVYWNRNQSKFSVRLRYHQKNNLNNQYLEGGQKTFLRENSLRIKGQISHKLSTQIDARNRHEEKRYKITGRTDKDIFSNEISLDMSLRPKQQFEVAIKSKWSHAKNQTENPMEVNFFAITPRINFAFRSKGRLRAELEFNQVNVTPENAIVPYEMVSGYRGGTNTRWLAAFDYNVSRYIRASVSWNGRYEEYLGKAIHTLRAEMRAYF